MRTTPVDKLFLPNFCHVQRVLALVVIAQLLAFILVLGPYQSQNRWNDLSLISLFIQWMALTSGALLCLIRPVLRKLSNTTAAAISYLLLLLITGLLSEVVYWILRSEAFAESLPSGWHLEFLLRNLGISAIVSALALRYFYIQHQWKKNLQSESEARIQALQSRIRPHFLFNSMNIIASLTRSQPHIAEAVVHDLSDLFRASLSEAHTQVFLNAELELSRKYLQIEKLRIGERLNVVWDIDELPGDALLPPLMVQPLVENAVYHGIEPLPEGGTIRIAGHCNKGVIQITISNPTPKDTTYAASPGNQIAVKNIQQRLEAYYGSQGRLAIETNSSDLPHYTVRLSFPYQQEPDEHPDR